MAYAPQGGNYQQMGGQGYPENFQQPQVYPQQQPGYPQQGYPQQGYPQPNAYVQPTPVMGGGGFQQVGGYQPPLTNEVIIVTTQQPGPQYFGRERCKFFCQTCNREHISNTEQEFMGWIAVIILIIFFCPLSWIPCCMDTCYRTKHSCPGCGMIVGFYQNS